METAIGCSKGKTSRESTEKIPWNANCCHHFHTCQSLGGSNSPPVRPKQIDSFAYGKAHSNCLASSKMDWTLVTAESSSESAVTVLTTQWHWWNWCKRQACAVSFGVSTFQWFSEPSQTIRLVMVELNSVLRSTQFPLDIGTSYRWGLHVNKVKVSFAIYHTDSYASCT